MTAYDDAMELLHDAVYLTPSECREILDALTADPMLLFTLAVTAQTRALVAAMDRSDQ